MPVQVKLSQAFLDGYTQSARTAMRNIADLMVVEMRTLAPFANPAQYPGGYPGTPGTLVGSIKRLDHGNGMSPEIVSTVPYAIRRNFENDLNPQTKHYVERSIENVLKGRRSQWWRAEGWQ